MTGRTIRVCFCCALLAAAGCATIRVDVDVYKGPLANHEDVQIEQMTVFAIGAKPLLINLRYELEKIKIERKRKEYEREGKNEKANEFKDKEKELEDIKFDEFIYPNDRRYVFDSRHAQVVNDILSLYLDVSQIRAHEHPVIAEKLSAAEDAAKALPESTSSEYSEKLGEYNSKYAELVSAVKATDENLAAQVQAEIGNQKKLTLSPQQMTEALRIYRKRAFSLQGLDRGRPNKGIERLVEEYLDEDPGPDGSRRSLDELSKALVHFAQKLLVLANNDAIIDEGKSKMTQKFSMALQAIGNALLVQIDELTVRRDHEKTMKGRAGAEVAALRGAFPDSSDSSIDWETIEKKAKCSETVTEALDLLISTLEYERIHAQMGSTVKTTLEPREELSFSGTLEVEGTPAGKLSLSGDIETDKGPVEVIDPRVANLTEALRLARAYRSGLVYIRPSSSYLRTSYAATGLQDDPNLTWRNMLGGMGLRNLPIFGGMWYRRVNDQNDKKAHLRAELDRQFWQNINRVKVSGTGNTNYVIAKDDIGNWYVKNMSADPRQIYESATKLAAFNFGGAGALGSLVPNDPAKESAEQVKDAAADPETPTDTRPPVEKVFDKYAKEYAEDTVEQITALKTALAESGTGSLPDKISDGWKALASLESVNDGKSYDSDAESLVKAYRKTLDDSQANSSGLLKQALAALPQKDDDVEQSTGAPITDALRFLRQYRNSLVNAITQMDIVNGRPAVKDQAQKVLDERKKAHEAAHTADGLAKATDDLADDDPAAAALATANKALDAAQAEFDRANSMLDIAQRAEKIALGTVKTVVGDTLSASIDSRLATIKEFESAVGYVQETVAQ